jgi:hypothetical protein
MRCLVEPIARRANREDGCTGRFWEGRFKSQALLDERAVLACALYVDLNPIRAGIAATPETSEHTSAKERIDARQARARIDALGGDPSASATPGAALGGAGQAKLRMLERPLARDPTDEVGADAIAALNAVGVAKAGAPAPAVAEAARGDAWLGPIGSGSSFLPSLELDEYLSLLDWTGRQLVPGKPGFIPGLLPPILERLRLDVARWVDTVRNLGRRFRRVIGAIDSIRAEAVRAGRRWLHGLTSARWAFGGA